MNMVNISKNMDRYCVAKKNKYCVAKANKEFVEFLVENDVEEEFLNIVTGNKSSAGKAKAWLGTTDPSDWTQWRVFFKGQYTANGGDGEYQFFIGFDKCVCVCV